MVEFITCRDQFYSITCRELLIPATFRLTKPVLTFSYFTLFLHQGVKPMATSLIKISSPKKFIWNVEKFSTLNLEEFHKSDSFTVGGCVWYVDYYLLHSLMI